MLTKVIDVYDRNSDITIYSFIPKRTKNIDKQVINHLESVGFRLLVQGSVTPEKRDLYWLASNKDYKNLHLSYREKYIEKKDIDYTKKYTSYNKWLSPVDVICYNELTTFENRIQAKNFYSRCMCCSEGSEHERYSNIFFSLDQTNDKMVHDGDCEYYEEPTIFKVGKFVKDHNETVEKLHNPMKYSQYLEYKKNKDMEVHL